MHEWLATWLWSCSRLLVIKSDEFIPFSLFEGRAQVKKTRISILCFLMNTTPCVSQTYITLFFLSILISPATLMFTLPKSVSKNSFNIGSMDRDQQREWCSSLTSVYTFTAPWTSSFPSFALGPLLRKILWINKRPSHFPCVNNSLLSHLTVCWQRRFLCLSSICSRQIDR